MFVFFTNIVGKDVLDRHGRFVGHPYDFTANFGESYPRITSLIISSGVFKKTYFSVPWKDVHQSKDGFQLKVSIQSLVPVNPYEDGGEITLRSGILDQQVVDTYNRKVVRVNDLHFLRVDDELRLAHVDIGFRGLVRRLGFEKFVDAMVRFFNRHSSYLGGEGFIAWKYVQPLSIQETTGKIHLNVEMEMLRSIPPSDISSMMMELDPYQRAALFKTMDVQSQVDIITELELKWQKDLVEELNLQAASALFERMPADEATDLLSVLSKRDAKRILGVISTRKAREISELMEHESDSAGGLMTKEFIAISEDMTVKDAIDYIKNVEISKVETIYTAFVTDDEGALIGAVSFRRLLLEPMDSKIGDVMQIKPPSVNVEDSVKEVAFTMDKYNLYALPAVDDDDVLEGIITADDVLHVAVEEAWGRRSGL